jgi:hypothetical protein
LYCELQFGHLNNSAADMNSTTPPPISRPRGRRGRGMRCPDLAICCQRIVICGQAGPAAPAVKKSPDPSAGAAPSRRRPSTSISQRAKSRPSCAVRADGPRRGCRTRPAARPVCSTEARRVLLLTAKNLRFQATPALAAPATPPHVPNISRRHWVGIGQSAKSS